MIWSDLVGEIQSNDLVFDEDNEKCWFEGTNFPYYFSTMKAGNMSLSYGAEEEVIDNRKKLYNPLNLERGDVVHMIPQHEDSIEIVNENDTDPPGVYADSLFTSISGLALEVTPADCYSLIISPKENDSSRLALIHIGRKNAGSDLIEDTFSLFDMKADQLQVAVSPGIGNCCHKFSLFRAILKSGVSLLGNNFDSDSLLIPSLKSQFFATEIVVRLQLKIINDLLNIGFPPENIFFSRTCTKCSIYFNEHNKRVYRFFSHARKDMEARNGVVAKNSS